MRRSDAPHKRPPIRTAPPRPAVYSRALRIRITPIHRRDLEALAKAEGNSTSDIVRQAIADFLSKEPAT
jgi:hypothetical protein